MAASPPARSASPTTDKGQSRNPISVRLYKILGSSFEDEASKEALQTLSDLYVQTPGSENIHTSAAATTQAMDREISTRNAASLARRHLRRDMEKNLTRASQQFLDAFGEVDQRLDDLQKDIDAMKLSCDEAERHLSQTTESSRSLLERAGTLREESLEVETKRSVVAAFLSRFTLNEEEAEAITAREVPVGARFFKVMDKVEQIREDCRILMSGEEGPTQAGVDIMSAMSSYLEQGYDKITRWCSNEFRQLGRDSQLEVHETMREAVKRLSRRPELLNEALSVLSQTRQSTLVSAFITALTRGGPSGLPRPIELHAHDPLRYIGDMLAWVHQTLAAEQEFLEALFGLRGKARMVGSVRVFEGKTEEEEWSRELLDSAVEKLCVPLKVRVQQTVRSQESSIVAYKVANLLQFYMLTMRRTIGEEALLSKTLLEMTDTAYGAFYESISALGRALLRTPLDVNDISLTPPLSILDHSQVLKEIMAVYQSSLFGEDESEQVAGFEKILDITIDPAVELCTAEHAEKRRLRPNWDHPIFVLNCLTYLQSILEPFPFTKDKQERIDNLIDEQVQEVTEQQFLHIMSDAGLEDIYATCRNRQPVEPLSRLPAAEPQALRNALKAFSSWLSGDEVVHSARLSQLTAQRLHTRIHQEALKLVAQAYKFICDEVRKPENRYEAASTLLGSERPFGQINLLNQIFSLTDDI